MAEKKSKSDATGVTKHDENYLGTSPEYENSAYEVTAPIAAEEPDEPDDDDDEVGKRQVQEHESEQRVREHLEAMKQPQPEVKAFSDWVGEREATRSGTTASTEEEASKADLMEEARDLDIPGRSSMTKDELAAAVADAKATGSNAPS
jgi:hypothetical protein